MHKLAVLIGFILWKRSHKKTFKIHTRIVSFAGSSPSSAMKLSGVPSKSFKCVRMRFSSPCFDKCTPRMEYQCSNSVADLIATHVFIWFSMNDNFAACVHDAFNLHIDQSPFSNVWNANHKILICNWWILTNLASSLKSMTGAVLLIELNPMGIFSSFYADFLESLKFPIELLHRDYSR